jgi:hypothetical protein
MPVSQLDVDTTLQPNHIYVIPPDKRCARLLAARSDRLEWPTLDSEKIGTVISETGRRGQERRRPAGHRFEAGDPQSRLLVGAIHQVALSSLSAT